ncbi:MAG: cytochrome P450 [Trueperaceae bacterium]|nr:MAG: cytochrome P450 [Trueperaceae bacterium]
MREPTTGALFQPTDPAFLADPYPTYARLRDEAPIAWFEGWSAWIVTRHRDVDALLRDRRLGRVIDPADASHAPPPDPAHAPFAAIQAGSLLEIEPPDHTRIKQAVHDVFTPRHVRALRERIDAIVRERIDALEARTERRADLIRDVAEPLPVTVIADLLGVPVEGRAELVPWSKAIIGMFEPERTPAMEAAAVRAAAEFAAAVRALIERSRAAPGDDLISRMTALHDADPARLSEGEIVANAILFLNAGHEAVVNVIGNGMLALLRHPEQHAALVADPDGVPRAVEEMLRFDTPLQFFERRVLEDMTYGGLVWPRGTKLCLYYASANRDPEVFDHPERFDVARYPNPHVSFGLGVHYCIGAPLARLELQSALSALLRLPNLRLDGAQPGYQPRNVFRYLTSLPVTY